MAAILLWWALAVHFAYDGCWNALYCTGSRIPMPGWLESREPIYRVIGPVGYDGQWFHVLAHDPLRFREHAGYMDAPRLRCQRILLPLAAWLLALGQFDWVDPAYYSQMLLWLGAGVYWTARLAQLRGAPAAWGFVFPLLSSTLSSIDRMLADGPLVAAAAGIFYFTETGRWRAAWLLAALAPFIRETGLLLIPSACAWFLLRKRWKAAALSASAALPFLVWLHSLRDLPAGVGFYWKGLFASALRIVLHPTDYPYQPWLKWSIIALDWLSLAGFLGCCLLCLAILWRRRREMENPRAISWFAGALFAAAALTLVHLEPRHAWDDFYSYGRVFSPAFLVAVLDGLDRQRLAAPLAALAAVAARMGLQFVSPAWRITRGILGI